MSKINNDIVLFGSVESSLIAVKSIRKSKYGNLKLVLMELIRMLKKPV